MNYVDIFKNDFIKNIEDIFPKKLYLIRIIIMIILTP